MILRKMKESSFMLSPWLRLPRICGESPNHSLTTILYHRFFPPAERTTTGRDRLHRQLDWLARRYTPVRLSDAVRHIAAGTINRALVTVTADDAHIDLLDAFEIFDEHRIPLTIFACVGWVANNEPAAAPPTISRVMDFLRWYQGDIHTIDLGRYGTHVLSRDSADDLIDDWILLYRSAGIDFINHAWPELATLRRSPRTRKTCTWQELKDLHSRGAAIGSHSVTHCSLASCSDVRLRFELEESRRAIRDQIIDTQLFAYPFGTPHVVNNRTRVALDLAGYRCALLTHAGFAANNSDVLAMPRIVVPDHRVSLGVYQALVRGAKVPLERFRTLCHDSAVFASRRTIPRAPRRTGGQRT